jgi:hypothetical protein
MEISNANVMETSQHLVDFISIKHDEVLAMEEKLKMKDEKIRCMTIDLTLCQNELQRCRIKDDDGLSARVKNLEMKVEDVMANQGESG